jgi:hypothetical protein
VPSIDVEAADGAHGHAMAAIGESAGPAWTALGLHTAAYLAVTALLSWIVYTWVGVAVLRKVWFNLDWLWACVLVATGVLVLLV